ncbi:MAG: hypothetical protein P8N63_15585 [Pseudomonadales bacterium]|nr:hypothetical protein [Pseudomonadales bacterium]
MKIKSASVCFLLALLCCSLVRAENFDLDVDDDGKTEPLTDGLLVIRYLFGFTGESLISGATSADAQRSSANDIETYLNNNEVSLDVDGNGEAIALSDGLLIIRALFGFTGDFLTTNGLGDGATRSSSDSVIEYIKTIKDSDNDGVLDNSDAFASISLGSLIDTDGDGIPNDCDSDCQMLGMLADQDDDNDGVFDEEDIDPVNSQFPLKIWAKTNSQRWKGSELEGQSPFCQDQRSQRWIAPVTDFDLNGDNKSDLLLPISCYQGSPPLPGEKHNQQVIAAWKMFCSKGEEHVDCTNELFGSDFINATGTDAGGGNPYIHVMATPEDINNDGYPDFWYALNRDDGRQGLDESVEEDRALLETYCGPQKEGDFEWDCTRKAIQSVLLSDTDGSYQVVTLPWGATNTQAMYVLPNKQGSIDVISVNYGRGRAARLDGRAFIDVTEAYETSVKNWAYVSLVDPYIKAFSHEGQSYFVSPLVPHGYILDPTATEFSQADNVPSSVNLRYGFTLWKWVPEVGFELSDVYQPAESEVFSYQFQEGEEVYTRYGAVIQKIPTFMPNWYGYEYIKLSEDDEPILVVVQESDGGVTLGDYFGAPVNAELIYKDSGSGGGQLFSALSESEKERTLDFQFNPVQSFLIQNGKLVLRNQSFVEGDVVYNTPGLKFSDLNGDGHLDMTGLAGGGDKGSTYINDAGTMRRLNLQYAFPEIEFTEQLQGGFGFTVRNMGKALRPEFIYWATGSNGESQAPNDFVILEAEESIDSVPYIEIEQIIQIFSLCGRYDASPSCLY